MKQIIQKASIVDVRTAEEFASGHFPGAVNIPLQEISNRVHEFRKMKQPIVAYCLSGGRSSRAVTILKQYGLPEIYNGGGLSDMLALKNHKQ